VNAYYADNFSPEITSVVVAGDINEADIKSKLSFLNDWSDKPVTILEPNADRGTVEQNTVYVINIPNAAQSQIRMGYLTGLNYDPTGTYYRLGIVNYILGGGFDSRLNMDLREEKGWTYGVSSGFASGHYGGYFIASTGVRSASTDSAVMELVKDIHLYNDKGINDEELEFTKNSIGLSDARKYETNAQKAGFLAHIQEYDLKPDFVTEENAILSGITKEQIDELAKKYLNPDVMSILIVGDKDKLAPGLQQLGYKIVELDTDGNIKQ